MLDDASGLVAWPFVALPLHVLYWGGRSTVLFM